MGCWTHCTRILMTFTITAFWALLLVPYGAEGVRGPSYQHIAAATAAAHNHHESQHLQYAVSWDKPQATVSAFDATFRHKWCGLLPHWGHQVGLGRAHSPNIQAEQAELPGDPISPVQLPPLPEAKAAFLAEHGPSYGYKGWLDKHWKQEIGVRLPNNQHYLDYTGAALYANSQLRAATNLLTTQAFGNPHSRTPSSNRSARMEVAARARVLKWLGANPKDYVLVWTRSATEALKMVGEWFPWTPAPDYIPPRGVSPGGVSQHTVGHVSKCGGPLHFSQATRHDEESHFVYTRANHKSVLGIGAYAQDKGALLSCADEHDIQEWLKSGPTAHGSNPNPPAEASRKLSATASASWKNQEQQNVTVVPTYSLLAYPAKDNYEGVLYPLDWIHKVKAKSTASHRWLVLLDAAAYLPIHPLNLTDTPADFVTMSFYKVFGYPTGLGALVMRKDAAAILHKVYFGGGAVDDATAEDVWRMLSPAPARFQDGTIDFLSIAQLQFGFDLLERLGGMQATHRHVSALQAWTYKYLSSLHHSNKQPLLTIFGKHDKPKHQSCLFQFLVHRPNGSVLAAEVVEVTAAVAGLHIRTGCHCNPGQCLKDLGIRPQEERAAALAHNTSHGFITVLRKVHEGPRKELKPVKLPIGSVRISLGALSTFEDVYAFVKHLQETYVDKEVDCLLEAAVAGGLGGWGVGHGSAADESDVTVAEYWNAKCGA